MINKESEDWNTIEIKSDLLCLGLSPEKGVEELYSLQNPYGDWKTGNVGLHILLNDKTHVLVTITHRFDSVSPYTINKTNRQWRLFKKSQEVAKVDIVPMPNWYNFKTSSGKQAPEIFLHEGKCFLHMEYIGCDFFKQGKPCKFCSTGSNWRVGSPKEIGEIVGQAFEENNKYHVCLGGGTRVPLSRDTDYFIECVKEIRQRVPDIPIFIEMVPPETDEEILELVNAGATSFGFNIEIWDDKLRKDICPGKVFVSKQRYLDACEYALRLLGPNTVGSCLLVGLEPAESSIEGAYELASRGIQPCMLPFKPWDGSIFKNKERCNPKIVLQVGEKVAQMMFKYDVNPTQNYGCLNCEACTIEHDILRLLRKGGKNK